MDDYYKGHHTHADADQHPETKRWVPKAHICWDENDPREFTMLTGTDKFLSREEAISYVVQLARKWIDDGKPKLSK